MKPLHWTTVINGAQKKAVTHFGTVYTITKDGHAHNWNATITVPAFQGHGGTVELLTGASFARARKACSNDYVTNGGR